MEMEFYVYNGFDPVVKAFLRTALIFSDKNYIALFFTVTALGLLFGGIHAAMMALSGKNQGGLAWVWPIGLGVVLYFSLIIPKGTLHIHDPVRQRYQPVSGIPDGIIMLVGTLNLIERGVVDILKTAGDPVGFHEQAGGIGFDMLASLDSKGILLSDQYMHASLRKYIEDCVFFELQRPGTTLTVNQLQKNNSFLPLFAEAMNPAIFTVYYENSAPRGTTLSCSEAYPIIQAKISQPAIYEESEKTRCAESGFDPTIPTEYAQCKKMLVSLINWLGGASYSATRVYQQTVIAREMNNVIMSSSHDTAVSIMASRNIGSSMLSGGIVANEWIPIIRAVLTSIIIGLLPFLALFIPTPLSGRALSMFLGFFVWLSAWGITDAIVHQFAMDYGRLVFEEVRQYQLGLVAISAFGTSSLKTLAAFGIIRWSGLGLATVLTSMLVRFGGHAISAMSGKLMSAPQAAGASAGQLVTPEGAAGALNKFEGAIPQMSNAHRFDFTERTGAKTAEAAGQISGMSRLVHSFGNHGASDLIASGRVGQAVQSGGYGRVAENHGLQKTLGLEEGRSSIGLAQTGATLDLVNQRYGGDVNRYAQMKIANDAATANAFNSDAGQYASYLTSNFEKSKGQIEGEVAAFGQAKKDGFQGGFSDYNRFTSEIQSTRGYQDGKAWQGVADQYFGGMQSKMFGAISGFHNTQAAAHLNKLQTEGYDEKTAGSYLGSIQALKEIGSIQGLNVVGDRGIKNPERSRVMDAATDYNQLVNKATMTGLMSDKNDQKGLLKYMERSHSGGSIVADKAMASKIQGDLKKSGFKNTSVQAGDKIDFTLNPETNRISSASITRGQRTEAYDLSSSQTGRQNTDIQRSEVKRSVGYEGVYGATLQGDSSPYLGVASKSIDLNTTQGKHSFNEQVFALSNALVHDQRALYGQLGSSTGSLTASGGVNGGIGLPFGTAGIKGGINIEKASREQDTTYLDLSSMIQVVEEGRAIADKSPSLSNNDRAGVIMNHVQKTVVGNYEKWSGADPNQFGSDAPVGILKDANKTVEGALKAQDNPIVFPPGLDEFRNDKERLRN